MAKVLVLVEAERIARFGGGDHIPQGWEIVYGLDMTDEERLAAAGDADYLYTGSTVEVSGHLIGGMPRLKLIQAEGVGFDKIDLAAASARGIPVCNCAGTNAGAVAEQTILLILAVQRFLVDSHQAIFEDRYLQTKNRIIQEDMVELSDCHVGLVGLGNIAVETAKRLKPFGCRISYWNRRPKPELERELGVDYLPLEELLAACDVVSLHTAATEETYHMMNDRTLSGMKPGAVLVNTARGALVDDAALARALEEGRLGGAGLDVQEEEPIPDRDPLRHLSREAARRLVLAPHLGGVTGATFRRQVAMAWGNLSRAERGEPPIYVVNGQ